MDRELIEHARANHGIVGRAVAHGMGASNKMLRTRERNGVLEEVLPDVFWHRAVPFTWTSKLKAATEWAKPAAGSHRSAAAMHALDGFRPRELEITTSRRVRTASGLCLVHLGPEMPSDQVRERDGIPITTIERTLLDLGSVCPRRRVEQGLDDALRQRITTLDRLQQQLNRFGGKGRGGAAILRTLVEERLDDGYTESEFEKMLLRMVHRFALPTPTKQHPVSVRGHNYRIDFAYPDSLIGVEALSYANHSKREDWEHDYERHGLLTAAGWLMLYVTYRRLCARPQSVAEDIRSLLADRQMF